LSLVVNYEEGGEHCVLHGDSHSEAFLHEVVGTQPLPGRRNLQIESVFEYGSRAGFWRLMRMFEQPGIQATGYAVAMALRRHPEAARAMVAAGHEIASHAWRWIDYQDMARETEREHMRRAIEIIERVAGQRPVGWYTGRLSPHTREL